MQRLLNNRVYLAGPMDRVPDRGQEWREYITPFLEELGIKVFNPLKKPTEIGAEDGSSFIERQTYKTTGQYDALTKMMKTIRGVDLRLVDISDFLIINLDLNAHMCGTYEELFLANRQKKPIIVHMVQGKKNTPDWLFGTIPHDMIFDDWNSILVYLRYINEYPVITTENRWYFFT